MPRRAHWIVAVFMYSVCAILISAGCARRTPELIAVTRLSPDRIAERDLLTISGEGLVTGADAVVKFSGRVFRAGQPPRQVNVEARGLAVDATAVEVQFTPALAAAFCAAETSQTDANRYSHATFRGEVRVSFVPRFPGAPPIEGRKRDVTLDIFSTPEQAKLGSEAPAQAASFLEFLGVSVEELGERGLRVSRLASGGRAASAGLQQGDVIAQWSSVRVHRVEDLEPFPGQRTAEVGVVRHGIAGEFPLTVSVEGYRPTSASGWWMGLVAIGALVITLILSRSTVSQWLLWLALVLNRGSEAGMKPVDKSHAVGPFLFVSVLFLALALDRRLFPSELDLVWVTIATSVFAALFGLAAARRRQRFSLVGYAALLFRQLPVHLGWWTCVLVVVLEYGRASVWELGVVQTLDPRSLGAFASPASFLVLLALLLASGLLTLCSYAPSGTVEGPFWMRVNRVSRTMGDTAALLLGGIAMGVFLGGWSTRFEPSSALGVGEALSFQLRFTVFYVGFLLLRRSVPSAPAESFYYFGTRWLLPLAGAALISLPVWGADVWPAWLRSGTRALLLCTGTFMVIGVPALVFGLRRVFGGRLRATGLNPWL